MSQHGAFLEGLGMPKMPSDFLPNILQEDGEFVATITAHSPQGQKQLRVGYSGPRSDRMDNMLRFTLWQGKWLWESGQMQ